MDPTVQGRWPRLLGASRTGVLARAKRLQLLLSALAASALAVACGGGGSGGGSSGPWQVAPENPIQTPPPAVTGTVVLKPPVLSFTDTGLSVTDGVTRIGAWQVSSLVGWEYSLDQGKSWIRGQGDFFDVTGDGAKMIWVRARDDAGNLSEIVMVTCVLDTMPPAPIEVTADPAGLTQVLRLGGLESGARWEYSLDDRKSWLAGSGPGLGIMGNGLAGVWLRQLDIAGNVSQPRWFALESPPAATAHEASGNPMMPSTLTVQGLQTLVLHGSVVRGDADYVRWQIPDGSRIASLRLVHYVSDDPIAFYALQRATVFDAGVDVTRMLVYGHVGPPDLLRNVLAAAPAQALGAGPMTLWFQQTGVAPTNYAIELVFAPAQ